jgi:hypothetical protein
MLVLALTGVVGAGLALHGWNARHGPAVLGSIGRTVTSSASSVPAAPKPEASASPGPFLRSQPFDQYAYAIWPGKPGATARAAQAGLTITVRRRGRGLSVVAGVTGQPPGAPHYYPLGARVYVIEASFGDDSGNSDYNLGDDGITVTDAAGRIVT